MLLPLWGCFNVGHELSDQKGSPPTFNLFSCVSSLNKSTKTRRFHFLLYLVYHVPYISINVCVCNIIYASCSGAVGLEYGHFRFPVLNGPLVTACSSSQCWDQTDEAVRLWTSAFRHSLGMELHLYPGVGPCLSVQAYSQMQ